jgi:glycosyltransferase involved in cell wall biosynthesis
MNNKNILHLLPALNTGGVENEVIQLSILAKQNGYNIFVMSAGGTKVSDLLSHNITHIKLKIGSKNPIIFIYNIFFLNFMIKKYFINIVHVHSRVPAWCLYFANLFLNVKIISTIHGAYSISGEVKKFYNAIMLKANKILAVSDYIKNYILTKYKTNKDIEIVHCGVDTNIYNPSNITTKECDLFLQTNNIPQDKPIILLPGRVVKSKGHDILLECLKILPKNSVTCIILGNAKIGSNYIDSLKLKIQQYNLNKRVYFINAINNMKIAYGAADIIISASIKPEAFGLTLIEAMSMKKIVVASNIGGAKEIINNKKNGFLFKAENVLDLKKTIFEILKMTEKEKNDICNAARNHVLEYFSIESKNIKMLEIYRNI